MEQLEGRIEERIGKGLESYAAVTQKTQKQKPIMMKEIIKEAMAQQAEEEKDIEEGMQISSSTEFQRIQRGELGASQVKCAIGSS